MIFRKATQNDADRCLEIYDQVSDWEQKNERQCFWEKGFYPTMDTVQGALLTDNLYVLEDIIDDKKLIVACGIINNNQGAYYKNFRWKLEAADSEVLVLHTFAVSPDFQKRCYGQTFLDFYTSLAQKKGCKVLRLDTVLTNTRAQAMYKKNGFTIAGQWEGDPNEAGLTLVFLGLEKKV